MELMGPRVSGGIRRCRANARWRAADNSGHRLGTHVLPSGAEVIAGQQRQTIPATPGWRAGLAIASAVPVTVRQVGAKDKKLQRTEQQARCRTINTWTSLTGHCPEPGPRAVRINSPTAQQAQHLGAGE